MPDKGKKETKSVQINVEHKPTRTTEPAAVKRSAPTPKPTTKKK